ncbi:MAG: radical SAM family heme chaperone HemW [Gemmatimonadetes bacterium]|nr:radical SAM family heme chaperone HemW [Gemmatimonadota bacterium]
MKHIYIHVPFCTRRCSYCDFSIAVRKSVPANRYVAAITAELEHHRTGGTWEEAPMETLYFGGGTPSLLPSDQVAALIGLLAPGARRPTAGSSVPEITLEANPDDVTAAAAAAWAAAGVTRISLGAQSFDPRVLQWMHRTHDVAAISRAAQTLRSAGIREISLDLIFGLPEELAPEVRRDLEAALELQPDHLSVYGLSIESRTPLARWVSRGATSVPSDERYAREFLLAHEVLTAAGFEHYEVSNYARPGHRSRHNSMYWTGSEFVGLGPAAHSYRHGERSWNLPAWAAYERALAAGANPTADRERLTDAQRAVERIYLGLRTTEGLEKPHWRVANPRLEGRWKDQGWVVETADRYRLSAEGWLRLDEIASVLTTSVDGG